MVVPFYLIKVDLRVGLKGMKEWNRNEIDAVHRFQDDKKIYRLSAADLRLNMIWLFENNSSLSMTYTAELARRKGGNTATTVFLRNGDLYSDMASQADKKINTGLHNVRLDYSFSFTLNSFRSFFISSSLPNFFRFITA